MSEEPTDTEPALRQDVTPGARKPRTDRDRERARERYARQHPEVKSRGQNKRTRTKPAGNRSLEGPIRETLKIVGGVWGSAEDLRGHADPTCGEVLIEQSPQIAKALNAVAQEDESVYIWLDRMLTGGGWGAVAFTMLPVFNAFAANHVAPALARRQRAALEGEWPETEPSPAVMPIEKSEEPGPEHPNQPGPIQHGPDFEA